MIACENIKLSGKEIKRTIRDYYEESYRPLRPPDAVADAGAGRPGTRGGRRPRSARGAVRGAGRSVAGRGRPGVPARGRWARAGLGAWRTPGPDRAEPCSPLQPGSIVRHKSRDVARPFRRAAMGSVGSQHLQEPSMGSTPHRSVVMSFDGGPLEEVAAGVAQAQGSRARGIPIFTDSEEPVPDDRYRAVYFATLLAGVGFLLPYNSFITDVDYLHHKYPGTSIVFDMSLTYILVALVAVLLNNALVERLSLHTRITAGAPPAAHPAPGPHTWPSHALHSLRAPHSPRLLPLSLGPPPVHQHLRRVAAALLS
uniref:Uncharacterized protein LOC117312099 n=1 Tax=Tursiops truncatus TaxID=9739 RepID=A0A6J3R8E5_TURTR|nr:uncharacterized protein LOC117312099 [Tursiops truncatus]